MSFLLFAPGGVLWCCGSKSRDEAPKRDNMKKQPSRLSIVLNQSEKKAPRLFNVIAIIILPLIFLSCLSLLCGHFLAVLESGNELDTLHESMISIRDSIEKDGYITNALSNTYKECLDDYIKDRADQHINGTELSDFMVNCTQEVLEYTARKEDEIIQSGKGSVMEGIFLNWNRCFYDGNETVIMKQMDLYRENWYAVFESSFYEHWETISLDEAWEIAMEDAKAAMKGKCSVNSAGGAMFWVTIMTTIGYGNTAPVTKGGRALVFTVGFVSILIFTILISQAGYVFLKIADDFFNSIKLKMLTKGWLSICFWLSILWLWFFAISGIVILRSMEQLDSAAALVALEEMIWWVYISVTTVGFGDHYIRHDTFLFKDIWYIPLLMLMGFVFFANFLLKLAESIKEKLEDAGFTDDESLNNLLSQRQIISEIVQEAPLDVIVTDDKREKKSVTNIAEHKDIPARTKKERKRNQVLIVLDRTKKIAPRLFDVVTMVALPLVFMICLAMLCGHFLAILESENELDFLHNQMGSFLDWRKQSQMPSLIIMNAYDKCINSVSSNTNQFLTGTDLRDIMDKCMKEDLEEVDKLLEEIYVDKKESVIGDITLNWNRCFYDGDETKLSMMGALYGENWMTAWKSSYEENLLTKSEDEALEIANEHANVITRDNCSVNTAGGTMFWFTIMTTIGYGNTVPATKGGRALIYSVGFVTIIIFAALSGTAGYVFLTIADDFFISKKLKMLTKGWLSVCFWFSIIWLWVMVLAGVRGQYFKDRRGFVEPLEDRVWWAYISITTVGLGDFYIPHDTFLFKDVWYIPLLLLMGFVFVANFLLKLSDFVYDTMKKVGNWMEKESYLENEVVTLKEGKNYKDENDDDDDINISREMDCEDNCDPRGMESHDDEPSHKKKSRITQLKFWE